MIILSKQNNNVMNEKISVITVCWNCVDDIEKTILSVISQTYSNIEYIIVDGASTDGTLDIIKRYETRISILISEPDKGIYNAMNKGVRLANGKWCIFMNAGDVFASSDVLKDMFELRHPMPQTKVYYGNTTYVNEKREKVSLKATLAYPTILRCQPYCHQSAFFYLENKKEPFFDEKYKIASDYNTSLWFFITYGKEAFEFYDENVSEFTAFGGTSTLEKNKQRICKEYLEIWKPYAICRKRYLIDRFKYFIKYEQPIKFLVTLLDKYTSSRKESERKNRIIK